MDAGRFYRNQSVAILQFSERFEQDGRIRSSLDVLDAHDKDSMLDSAVILAVLHGVVILQPPVVEKTRKLIIDSMK